MKTELATWKTKTCRDCFFNVDHRCRRFPPSLKDVGYPWTVVMVQFDKYAHQQACAEYAEDLSPPRESS